MHAESLIYRCGQIGASYEIQDETVSVKYKGFTITNIGNVEDGCKSLLMTLGGLT